MRERGEGTEGKWVFNSFSGLYWNRALKADTLGQPEGWDGEGVGKGFWDGGHMYTHDWFMSMYGKNHHNILM